MLESSKLHLRHISSGDPFEKGSSRPLDFGHWSAHKLETMTRNRIRHGEAVAIGMALDIYCAALMEMIPMALADFTPYLLFSALEAVSYETLAFLAISLIVTAIAFTILRKLFGQDMANVYNNGKIYSRSRYFLFL